MQPLPGNIDTENNHIEIKFWKQITNFLKDDETAIVGYKNPSLGIIIEETPTFIIRSKQFGIVVIEMVSKRIKNIEEEYWETVDNKELYSRDNVLQDFVGEIRNRFSKYKELYNRREKKFNIPIIPILVFVATDNHDIENENIITKETYFSNNFDDLKFFHSKQDSEVDKKIYDFSNSVLDGTIKFNKRVKKKNIVKFDTINDYIQKSLEETFKLDFIQRSVAMQIPKGPQRIRGLAGTGKTVILCMKAALAHKDKKNFKKILFLFNTQSMYNQITKYISDYYLNEAKAIIDPNRIEILHTWGGKKTRQGLYSKLCEMYGIAPKTYFDAKYSRDALDYIYKDLLSQIKNQLEPIYDMVLIDEAQDFSPAIFETIFYITKKPKRIIWAYDEFQSLKELKIKEPEELFGNDKEGKPNMTNKILEGQYSGGIEKDFILPNSYRNPRLNLMIAHGIGLGLYTENASIPMKDKIEWTSRGYKIIEPDKKQFEAKDKIIVERPESNSKNILENLLKQQNKDDFQLVKYNNKANINAEIKYVITSIDKLIKIQNVEPEEILVITLDTRNSKDHLQDIRQGLVVHKIAATTPGYIESPDSFKEKGRVTLTTAFKAKGNEANVVFVINAQISVTDTTFNARNALFVSITRSRGWCFISGNGKYSSVLEKEFKEIIKDYPKFKFSFPYEDDIKRRLKIIKSNKPNLEKINKDIDKILQDKTYKALLMQKIKQDETLKNELGE